MSFRSAESPSSTVRPVSRDRYLRALVDLQQDLLSARDEAQLHWAAVDRLGAASGASRVYVFTNDLERGELVARRRALWCAPGVTGGLDVASLGVPFVSWARFEWARARLAAGEAVAATTAELGDEERAFLEPQGVQSLLLLPLIVDGDLEGVIGFDDCREPRQWTASEADLLRGAATALSLSIARSRAETRLRDRELRSREAQLASELMFRTTFCEAPIGIWIVGKGGIVIDANPAVLRLVGRTREELVGRNPFAEITHPEDMATCDMIARASDVGADLAVLKRYVRKDGKIVRVRLDTTHAVIGDGTPVSISMVQDITATWEAEQALRLSNERFRLLAQATKDAVYDWHTSSNVIEWNAGAGEALGYPVEEIGADLSWWSDRIHDDDRGSVLESLHAALDRRDVTTWSHEYRFRQRDGSYAHVLDRGLIMRDAEGAAMRMIGTMMDMSERKAMEQRLLVSERMSSLGMLAAGVAHEINNPLAYVSTNLDVLGETLHDSVREERRDDVGQMVSDARDGVQRVARIVRQLKSFSRTDDEAPVVLDLRAVLDTAAALAGNEVRARAALARRYDEVPRVRATEGRLVQVFLNLLINAAQSFADADPGLHVVRIATGTDAEGRAVVEISDDGEGIARENLARIFEPFFTTKPAGVGTGLGLSICHNIVVAMGGHIAVESTRGRGTTVRVTLPAASGTSAASTKHGEHAPETERRLRVLVIDDEAAIGVAVRRLLRGFVVDVETDGAAAIDRLEQSNYDAVLCDLMMPHISGIDVFERVSALRPDLAPRFVFMTGGAFTDRTREFLETTKNATVAKPFRAADLRQLLARVAPRVTDDE